MATIPPLFKQETCQSLFEKNGFVKVPLLSDNQAEELAALFETTRTQHETVSNLHHTTTDTQNPELIYKVDAAIKKAFQPELEKILVNFKPLAGCFHIKEPGAGSATGVHQDPTFVDETKYCSANVWVALHDMNAENGNLFFVSGSQNIAPSLRITPYSPTYYESFNQSLPEMAVQVPMKKGEAVIFNNGTIHGATDNITHTLRLAATLLVCSGEADWLIYFNDPANKGYDKIEEYRLDLPAFVSMAKNGRPSAANFTRNLSYKFPSLTKEEFEKQINRRNGNSWWKRILNL